MTKQEIIELSVEVTTEYYKNNIDPFLSCLDKKAQWYGPAQGQFLIGRDAIRAAYKAEPVHSLSFTMENIQVNAISTSPSFYEVMLRFYVTTRYPDGKSFRHFQRIHLTWSMHRIKAADGTRSFIPKILMCSITNPHPNEVMTTTASIEKNYPNAFLRCHTSYLVNPCYVKGVKRFSVLMDDGSDIPISQKRFATFKKVLEKPFKQS